MHARFGRSRRPGEGSWKMRGGLWNEWDRKWQGAPCFNGPEGCPALWHVVAGNLRGRLRLCCQFAIAIAIASEDSRLAARAAIKGHLKTDLLRVCKPRSLGSEHLLLSAPRHELGAMQRRLTFQHPWKLGSLEVTRGCLDKRGSLPVRVPRDVAWCADPVQVKVKSRRLMMRLTRIDLT